MKTILHHMDFLPRSRLLSQSPTTHRIVRAQQKWTLASRAYWNRAPRLGGKWGPSFCPVNFAINRNAYCHGTTAFVMRCRWREGPGEPNSESYPFTKATRRPRGDRPWTRGPFLSLYCGKRPFVVITPLGVLSVKGRTQGKRRISSDDNFWILYAFLHIFLFLFLKKPF